jgi:pyrroloquinoline quinone biosynthesis protein B
MPRMAGFLRTNGPWSQLVKLSNIELREMKAGEAVAGSAGHGDARAGAAPAGVSRKWSASASRASQAKVLFIPDIDSWRSGTRPARASRTR